MKKQIMFAMAIVSLIFIAGCSSVPPPNTLSGCLHAASQPVYAVYKLPIEQRAAAYERLAGEYKVKEKACLCTYGNAAQKAANCQ